MKKCIECQFCHYCGPGQLSGYYCQGAEFHMSRFEADGGHDVSDCEGYRSQDTSPDLED